MFIAHQTIISSFFPFNIPPCLWQILFIVFVTIPSFILLVACVVGSQYLCIRIVEWIRDYTSVDANFYTPKGRRTNYKGVTALYAVTGLSATFVWFWNWVYGRVALKLTTYENHATGEAQRKV